MSPGAGIGLAAVTFLTPYRMAELLGAARLAGEGTPQGNQVAPGPAVCVARSVGRAAPSAPQ